MLGDNINISSQKVNITSQGVEADNSEEVNMNRGGSRRGAGRKAGWRHGETQTIRIPVALREQLLEIARQLDNKEFIGERMSSELNTLLGKWEAKCNAQPASSTEWQKVRQLIDEIQEIIAPEAYEADQLAEIETDERGNCVSRRAGCTYRQGRHHNCHFMGKDRDVS